MNTYDDVKCFICVKEGEPGAELVEGRWHGKKIWLCPDHHRIVTTKMRRDAMTEDQALDAITNSVMKALFPGWKIKDQE
ncbi:hypothetical protein FCK90_08620 [Kocuria coralli]|uniref:Uncharacterized protein n=1 Tax=Kocuria coralli TaxID=1461025 RepID=A0A5J5KWX0_9MICC|nr:hypothetical protein [Kocuria coralli]KAA9394169.1 hypothetical protein FCK90_08620 [Kocuria coralli]